MRTLSNLPPGVTSSMIERAFGEDAPCEVCGKDVDACICPECPVCHSCGDPDCYEDLPHSSVGVQHHGLAVTRAQWIGRAERSVAEARDRLAEAEIALALTRADPEDAR